MANQTGKTLLIVEHQAITRDALALMFRSEGYRVITATDARDAVGRLDETPPPQLVLFDLRDANGDDRMFLEQRLASSALAAVPLVLMTEEPADSKWLSLPGVAGTFRKPVPLDPLLDLVRRCG